MRRTENGKILFYSDPAYSPTPVEGIADEAAILGQMPTHATLCAWLDASISTQTWIKPTSPATPR